MMTQQQRRSPADIWAHERIKAARTMLLATWGWFNAQRARSVLLGCETVLTTIVFIPCWFICAVGFAVVGGFHMAKADSKLKAKKLDELFGKHK
jgi:hypothetical protein